MYSTLVDAATLAVQLEESDWVVLDCRFDLADKSAGERRYREGHIPGARFADLERDLSDPVTPASGRHPLPQADALAKRFGAWGIDDRVQVVVYDDAGGGMAVRCWWSLRWLGHRAVALLDGGLQAWSQQGYPLSREIPAPAPRNFVARACEKPVSTEEILNDPTLLLLDARTAVRYRGEEEPIDPVAGHIPGAVSAPFDANLDAEGRFRSPEALRARFLALLNGRDPRTVVHYCGSGVTACHNLLAMEHAGLSGSRLYPGFWSEWIRDPGRSIALGEE
ncbi:MAG: sulfurtransferase [Gammaproteobacteria bacterium]